MNHRGDARGHDAHQPSDPNRGRHQLRRVAHQQPSPWRAPQIHPAAPRQAASCTTRPATIVVITRPLTFHPANGVFRLLDRKGAGPTSHCAPGSTTPTSASAPGARLPLDKPKARAGSVVSLATAASSERNPSSTKASVSGSAVSSPTIPFGAAANCCCLSCTACGAWSVAITSIVPSRNPSLIACTSCQVRSGGVLLAWVVEPRTASSANEKWCGQTSALTPVPRDLPPRTIPPQPPGA